MVNYLLKCIQIIFKMLEEWHAHSSSAAGKARSDMFALCTQFGLPVFYTRIHFPPILKETGKKKREFYFILNYMTNLHSSAHTR